MREYRKILNFFFIIILPVVLSADQKIDDFIIKNPIDLNLLAELQKEKLSINDKCLIIKKYTSIWLNEIEILFNKLESISSGEILSLIKTEKALFFETLDFRQMIVKLQIEELGTDCFEANNSNYLEIRKEALSLLEQYYDLSGKIELEFRQ